MEYNRLKKLAMPGVILEVAGVSFKVDQVLAYKCPTNSWLNLVDQTSSSGEQVLELSDGDIRLWRQVLDLPGVSPAKRTVNYRGRHFKCQELMVQAKTVIREKAGKEHTEDSVTSVYVDEKDEDILLSIEIIEGKIFVWYSDKMIPSRDIKL